jgi:hypothetical protein
VVLIVVIVIVLVVIVGTVVMSAILFFLVSGLIADPGGHRPTATFAPVAFQGNATVLRIATMSGSAPFDLFQANLLVNSTAGTPVPVSPSFTITVGGDGYSVTFVDPGGERDLTPQDEFHVFANAGWSPGTYEFLLLWTDLTPIGFVSWTR